MAFNFCICPKVYKHWSLSYTLQHNNIYMKTTFRGILISENYCFSSNKLLPWNMCRRHGFNQNGKHVITQKAMFLPNTLTAVYGIQLNNVYRKLIVMYRLISKYCWIPVNILSPLITSKRRRLWAFFLFPLWRILQRSLAILWRGGSVVYSFKIHELAIRFDACCHFSFSKRTFSIAFT